MITRRINDMGWNVNQKDDARYAAHDATLSINFDRLYNLVGHIDLISIALN